MGARVRRKNQPGVEHDAYTIGHGCFAPSIEIAINKVGISII
jgi:hypothetical protein